MPTHEKLLSSTVIMSFNKIIAIGRDKTKSLKLQYKPELTTAPRTPLASSPGHTVVVKLVELPGDKDTPTKI